MTSMNEADFLSRAWIPTAEFIATTNIAKFMHGTDLDSYEQLHAWSMNDRERFWGRVIDQLQLRFRTKPQRIVDLSSGVETPQWLPGAKLNIAESCFNAPADSPAIISQSESGPLQTMSVGELATLSDRIALNLVRIGMRPGDAVAIIMPMTADAVAIYLGIVKAGCAVVGIADSFQSKEIATRFRLSQAAAVFTQDVQLRGGKVHPQYENVVKANGPRAIVLAAAETLAVTLRDGDMTWQSFLKADGPFEAVALDPDAPSNILFSSGTTGDPKVIPWSQTTPIKCAADGYFHQNIQPGNVVVWPTNLGWMMGPWLIYASLINRATIGLFNGAPTGAAFGKFVQDVKANVLGVVPSLINNWRQTGCMNNLDWSSIRAFSSTGECSCPDDMAWLMTLPGGAPVIEYCGGTELGGGYIASTVTRPCVPGMFNTPTLGIDFKILDESGSAAPQGELYLVPPSIGMSTTLLDKDHHEVYYAGAPRDVNIGVLRRHGDEMKALPGGYWRALGRADDTMNLGGIKVSSAEIEEVLKAVPDVVETAAIAVAHADGPSQLVIYAVCKKSDGFSPEQMRTALQGAVRRDLNPLFKIHSVVFVDSLPRTASNKVMRRVLRDQYLASL